MPTGVTMVWTVGHSTHPIEEFISLLKIHTIETVADVRLHPGSRKFPHFNKDPLSGSLEATGIEYIHFPDLGGRRKPRPDSRNTAWRSASFRGYADYMETAEFQGALGRLLQLAATKRVAIMCAEAVWWRCHRGLISDILKARGHRVLHIQDGTEAQEHPYTSGAHVVEGALTYSGAESLFGREGAGA